MKLVRGAGSRGAVGVFTVDAGVFSFPPFLEHMDMAWCREVLAMGEGPCLRVLSWGAASRIGAFARVVDMCGTAPLHALLLNCCSPAARLWKCRSVGLLKPFPAGLWELPALGSV